MALYTPDHKYDEGKKLLEETDTPEGELIRYYVSKQNDYIDQLLEQIKEMQAVFNGIKKFMR